MKKNGSCLKVKNNSRRKSVPHKIICYYICLRMVRIKDQRSTGRKAGVSSLIIRPILFEYRSLVKRRDFLWPFQYYNNSAEKSVFLPPSVSFIIPLIHFASFTLLLRHPVPLTSTFFLKIWWNDSFAYQNFLGFLLPLLTFIRARLLNTFNLCLCNCLQFWKGWKGCFKADPDWFFKEIFCHVSSIKMYNIKDKCDTSHGD